MSFLSGSYNPLNQTFLSIGVDTYALGVTAYTLLTGAQVWTGSVAVNQVANYFFDAPSQLIYGIANYYTDHYVGPIFSVANRSAAGGLQKINYDPTQVKWTASVLIPGLNRVAVWYSNLFSNSTEVYSLDDASYVTSWTQDGWPDTSLINQFFYFPH